MAQNNNNTDEKNDEILQWVTFALAGETYGINVMQVKEVLRYSEIAAVPGSPDYVLGIINLRGTVMTVIDMRLRFSLPSSPVTNDSRIVVIEADGKIMGMLVDSVAEVVYLQQSQIESAPSIGTKQSAKFIQGVCHLQHELLILVDLNQLLSNELTDMEAI